MGPLLHSKKRIRNFFASKVPNTHNCKPLSICATLLPQFRNSDISNTHTHLGVSALRSTFLHQPISEDEHVIPKTASAKLDWVQPRGWVSQPEDLRGRRLLVAIEGT